MSKPIDTYVNDHLGGAQIAIELLEAMQEQHDDQHFRDLAKRLLPEIQADDEILRSISAKLESSPSALKQAGGWLLEKATRLKLGHTGMADFSLFESLEMLELGIHGKLCLWTALQATSSVDERLRDYDFKELIRRANQQGDQVEKERVALARIVFVREK